MPSFPSKESKADVLIIGGGLGGVAAALAAMRLGRHTPQLLQDFQSLLNGVLGLVLEWPGDIRMVAR